jgi:hypothetical protein
MLELVIDAVGAALLALTSASCLLLHRRIRSLHASRDEVQAFVHAIDAATCRAETAIKSIRETAGEVQLSLAKQQEAAEQQIAELARLIDAGSEPTSRLERTPERNVRAAASGAGREPRAGAGGRSALSLPSGQTGEVAKVPGEPAAGAERPAPKVDIGLLKALEALR